MIPEKWRRRRCLCFRSRIISIMWRASSSGRIECGDDPARCRPSSRRGLENAAGERANCSITVLRYRSLVLVVSKDSLGPHPSICFAKQVMDGIRDRFCCHLHLALYINDRNLHFGTRCNFVNSMACNSREPLAKRFTREVRERLEAQRQLFDAGPVRTGCPASRTLAAARWLDP